MVTTLRVLVVLSISLLLAGLLLPFDAPFEVDLPLDKAPPAWFFASLALVGVAIAGCVASIGLLRLRRWAKALAVIVSVCGAVAVWFLLGSPVAESMSGLAAPSLGLSAATWLAAVGLSYHPSVASRFRAGR